VVYLKLFHFSIISMLYEKTNRPALALAFYKKTIALRDTVFSKENSKKTMQSEMEHEYEKKKLLAETEHRKEIENQKAIAEEKRRKQNIILWSVAIGLILVIVFAGFVLRSLRTSNKQKKIIEIKSKETEEQKLVIEEKQKEIIDSIKYAKRIQQSQLPTKKYIEKSIGRLKKD
jgi:hypothetical protein